MTPANAQSIAAYLDSILGVAQHPDYAHALNGLQLSSRGPVVRIGAAVDLSLETASAAGVAAVNFLVVHHGMFWGGLQRLVGPAYERIQVLLASDIGVYAVHLPLDSHPEYSNSALLARHLELAPTGGFARYEGVSLGVQGESDLDTGELVSMVAAFALGHATVIRTTRVTPGRRTRRWAICTGAGINTEILSEAAAAGIDTLIVGEGPHHSAIDAIELGITVVYAGHYATETLGVQAVAQRASEHFALPWVFLPAPTGL